MELLVKVAAFGMLALGVVLFAVQYLARELGYWVGRRHATAATEGREGIGVLVGTMLGLLSFVIAVSLGNTTTRFEQRRTVALNEANAIGTAWLRTAPIDHPRSAEIARILERYARVRADFVRAPSDQAVIDALEEQTGSLQQGIWREFSLLMREVTNPATANLEIALNQVIDAASETRFALFSPYAARLLWLLMSMSLITMAALGYQLGLQGRPLRVLAALLTLLWTMVIVDILDVGAARLGGIRMSVEPYEWTIQSFGRPRGG